jgi:cytochrome d ubiquinol oxidase subunit II
LKRRFLRLAAWGNVLVVIVGGLVFAASLGERDSLPAAFLRDPLKLTIVALATLLFVVLWFFVTKRHIMLTRIVASGQVALILFGWYVLYAPNAMITAHGPLSFYHDSAPPATLRQLELALLIGSFFIFPSLFYLFSVFKRTDALKQ